MKAVIQDGNIMQQQHYVVRMRILQQYWCSSTDQHFILPAGVRYAQIGEAGYSATRAHYAQKP
jgi:hypothetical protein